MNTFTKTVFAATLLCLTVSLPGCSGKRLLPALTSQQHIPANGIVLAPNEKITLNALSAKQNQYFCSNGTVLQCERLSFKLHCRCPKH
jgi:hypothetical protein